MQLCIWFIFYFKTSGVQYAIKAIEKARHTGDRPCGRPPCRTPIMREGKRYLHQTTRLWRGNRLGRSEYQTFSLTIRVSFSYFAPESLTYESAHQANVEAFTAAASPFRWRGKLFHNRNLRATLPETPRSSRSRRSNVLSLINCILKLNIRVHVQGSNLTGNADTG